MRVRAHIATSAVLGVGLYLTLQSMPAALAGFLSGVLIDLDHVLECYLNYGKKFNVRETIKICDNCELKKAHIFLHSYEFILIYAVIIYLFNLKGEIWYGIGFGLTLHILLDSIFNSFYPNGLFFIKRLRKGFNVPDLIDVEAQRIKNKRR